MKKKDIIVMIFSLIIVFACILYFLGGFGSGASTSEEIKPTETTFQSTFNEELINELKDRKNYGTSSDSDIGRSNPFASF